MKNYLRFYALLLVAGVLLTTQSVLAQDFSLSRDFGNAQLQKAISINDSNGNVDREELREGQFQNQVGSSVDVQGRWVIVGARNQSPQGTADRTGMVFVYERDVTDGSLTLRQELAPRSMDFSDTRSFGSNVMLHGELLFVGASTGNASTDGSIFIYRLNRSNNSWEFEQRIRTATEGTFNRFGDFFDTDGSYLIAGTTDGEVEWYINNPSGWTRGPEVVLPGYDGPLGPGVAVLNRDEFAIQGEEQVFIVRRFAGQWTVEAEIPLQEPVSTNRLHYRLAASGNHIAIADLTADSELHTQGGAVYLYTRLNAGQYNQTDRLTSPSTDRTTFGTSLKFSGNSLLIGDNERNNALLFTLQSGEDGIRYRPYREFPVANWHTRTQTSTFPAIGIDNDVVVTGSTTRTINGESYIYTFEHEFQTLANYEFGVRGSVYAPSLLWYRTTQFINTGFGFIVSGRDYDNNAVTRSYFAPDPGRGISFNNEGQLMTDLHARPGGVQLMRFADREQRSLFVSGEQTSPQDPFQVRILDLQTANLDEIPTNLPHIGGKAEWADLNGNGKLDVVMTGLEGTPMSGTRRTAIFFQQEDNQFEELVIPEIADKEAQAIVIADIFNRGLPDILLGGLNRSGGGSEMIYLRNLGNGQFEIEDNPLSYSGGSFIRNIAFGDLTNNGHFDLVIGGWADVETSPIGIWHNNGDGTFDRIHFWSIFNASNFDVNIQLVDINNNGRLDVIHSSFSDRLRRGETMFFINQGERSYSIQYPYIPTLRAGAVVAGDLNVDGRMEFLAYGEDDSRRPVLKSFTNARAEEAYDRPNRPENVGITINENGRLALRWDPGSDDITPQEALTYNVRVANNNLLESFTFDTGNTLLNKPGNAGFNTSYELPIFPDEEGLISIGVHTRNHHIFGSEFANISWRTTNRFVNLLETRPPTGSGEFYPAWVDVNRDGNLDLAFRNRDNGTLTNTITVFDFSTREFVPMESEIGGPRAIWADFNNNGYPDAMVREGASSLSLWTNEGGEFTQSESSISVNTRDYKAVDINNNGRTDIIFASGSVLDSNRGGVVYNMGDNNFQVADTLFGRGLSIDAADVNRNGCKDILYTTLSFDNAYVLIYENDCDGNFGAADTVFTLSGGIGRSHFADLTGSGYPDIVSIMSDNNDDFSESYTVYLLENKGEEGFELMETYEDFRIEEPSIEIIDITGNGYLDIILNQSQGTVSRATALINNGDGTFELNNQFGIEIYNGGMIAAADAYNSGMADVFIGGQSVSTGGQTSRHTSFYRNFRATPYTPTGAPVNLDVETDQYTTLSWSPGDEGTTPIDGVTYNIRVGTEPGGNDVVSGLALDNGKRLVVSPGNAGSATSITLRGLEPNTTYYWSVQAIDNLYNGSAFAEEQTFVSSPVSVDELDALPREVSLAQNFPNPFNPVTTIRFGLPADDQVSITVYDITGRVVAQVTNRQYTAGYHTVSFDGSRLASGVYLYRLQTGNTVLTRKMSLIK